MKNKSINILNFRKKIQKENFFLDKFFLTYQNCYLNKNLQLSEFCDTIKSKLIVWISSIKTGLSFFVFNFDKWSDVITNENL